MIHWRHFRFFGALVAGVIAFAVAGAAPRWDIRFLVAADVLGGGVVSSVLPPDASGRPGSYIDYIGVHRRARGRGVAKALLFTVLRDAAERGRGRVGLEVDADSPTGADGLYTSLGWVTDYRTQSWQRDIDVT